MKQTVFTGCATAMITPFTQDKQDVDYDFFEKLIGIQLQNGVNALVIGGTTGESPVLSHTEKINCVRIAKALAGKVTPVIVGAGSNDTQKTVKKCNEVEKEGVNGLLIVTPFYNKGTQDSVVKHYFYIADRVSTPIIVYNVPSRTGFNIKPETYLQLSEHKNIVAVKEANPDISQAAQSLCLCKDKLDFYSGNDDLTLPLMAMGAKGLISVASNLLPKQMSELTSYILKDDWDKASQLYYEYLPLMNLLFCETNPIPVKAATQLLYGQSCPLRLPLDDISFGNKQKLIAEMKSCQLID